MTTMNKGVLILLCQVIFLLLLIIVPANATVVFDSFGSGDSYNSEAWLVANTSPGYGTLSIANPFIPSASGNVSDIWLPVYYTDGNNALQVALMSDSGGQPGTVLETWTFYNVMSPYGSILHGIGSGTTPITAGVTYWLGATIPSGSTTAAAWYKTYDLSTGNFAWKFSTGFSGPWSTDFGFDPPEPAEPLGAFRVAVADAPTCDLAGAKTLGPGGWSMKTKNSPLTLSFFSDNFPGGLVIGETGRSVKLTTVNATINFLPTSGIPAMLPSGDSVNPTYKQIKNTLAGQAVATTLNLALSPGIGGTEIQTGYGIPFAGETVNDVLKAANQALGGASSTKTQLSNLTKALDYVNRSFENGYNSGYLACPSD